jgi:cleavage stimulation factor subunit 2
LKGFVCFFFGTIIFFLCCKIFYFRQLKMSNNAAKVFIGNIPYDATEEQLTKIFEEVGPVVSFRLLFDRNSGKPRGFGFCEYRDADTAQSAIRNLSGRDINGRDLRVSSAEKETQDDGDGSHSHSSSSNAMVDDSDERQRMIGVASGSSTKAAALAAKTNPLEATGTIMESLSKEELYVLMWELKNLAEKNPEQARQLLAANPQLAFAMLDAQARLGMVAPQMVRQIVAAAASAPSPSSGAPPRVASVPAPGAWGIVAGGQQAPPPQPQQQQAPPPPAPPHQAFAAPAPASMMMMGGSGGGGGGMPPPPGAGGPLGGAGAFAQQQALLQQVLSLTSQQIAQLPPHQAEQVRQLQSQAMQQQRGF